MRAIFVSLLLFLGLAYADPADAEQIEQAGIDDHAKAAYFVLRSEGYVWALNVADNGDVYFHMNAPASHSWMGIGFGSSMKDVRMIVSYLAADGHNLTNSCRMSHGYSEPVYDPYCKIQGVQNDTYAPFANTLSPGGIMVSHAVCLNCSTWDTGKIDVTSTAQQFIFALGPNKTLATDDPAANLRFHEFHGTFEMDMTVATNYTGWYGRVPAPQDPALQVGTAFWAFANYYSSDDFDTATDTNWWSLAHGVLMCFAFILVFPAGALSLRILKRIQIHAMAQALGFFFFLAGFALAIYTSKLFNKTKHFASAHQVIGLLIFAAMLIQISLGLIHHAMYLRTKGPSFMGKIHRFLGIGIMVFGLINAGVGFNFAGNSASNLPYGVVAALVGAIFCVLYLVILHFTSRDVYRPEKEHILSAHYGKDVPAEYEMHEAPFASLGQTQSLGTPEDDPEGYRSYYEQHASMAGWGETPASEQQATYPFPAQQEGGIHLR